MKYLANVILLIIMTAASTMAQVSETVPVSNPACSRTVAGANYCATFERLDNNTYEKYFGTAEQCNEFCNGTGATCTSNPQCINISLDDNDPGGGSGVTPVGEQCVTASNYCGSCGSSSTCSKDECEAINDGSRPINCTFQSTGLNSNTGQCIPESGQCASYCFAEVDLGNSVSCRSSRDECISLLTSNNPEPGDLRFPACGCDSSTISKPLAEGGCGLAAGDWDSGVGTTAGAISGSGISAKFTLDGFKAFQNVNRLYDDTNLPRFINTFIGFIIGITGAIVTVMIVVGGFTYVTAAAGGGKSKGKDLITNALIGLVLLLSSVALLNTVNPALLNLQALRPIQVEITREEFDGQTTPFGKISDGNYGTGNPGSTGGSCRPATSGYCSVAQLSQTCFGQEFPNELEMASAICLGESTNDPGAESKTDRLGRRASNPAFSFGLFQINITQHKLVYNGETLDCPSAFQGKNYSARITDRDLYAKCVTAAKNVQTNTNKACELRKGRSQRGQTWEDWGFWKNNCR